MRLRMDKVLRQAVVCMGLASVVVACGDDDESEPGGNGGTAGMSASGGSAGAAQDGGADAAKASPGKQSESCACAEGDPNFCDATGGNCAAGLSCATGACRTPCTGVDDTSCPASTHCTGIVVGTDDLGFWCS